MYESPLVFQVDNHIEEEVGTCRCTKCYEGAVVVKVTDTRDYTFDYFSNCCYTKVDIVYTDVKE